jgi:hypothetical protein
MRQRADAGSAAHGQRHAEQLLQLRHGPGRIGVVDHGHAEGLGGREVVGEVIDEHA